MQFACIDETYTGTETYTIGWATVQTADGTDVNGGDPVAACRNDFGGDGNDFDTVNEVVYGFFDAGEDPIIRLHVSAPADADWSGGGGGNGLPAEVYKVRLRYRNGEVDADWNVLPSGRRQARPAGSARW